MLLRRRSCSHFGCAREDQDAKPDQGEYEGAWFGDRRHTYAKVIHGPGLVVQILNAHPLDIRRFTNELKFDGPALL